VIPQLFDSAYEFLTNHRQIRNHERASRRSEEKCKVGGLQAACFFPIQPGESMGYCGALCWVEWIGQWGLFRLCGSS
jgi:hypothetical protein